VTRLALLAILAALALAPEAHAFVFEVNTTGDAGDLTCDATCTLRDAIDDANNLAGDDEIAFDFGGVLTTISPATQLPDITDTVVINGSNGANCSGAGFEQIVLDRTPVVAFDGLVLAPGSDGSRICKLNIRGFEDGIVVSSDDNQIDGCRIGTDHTAETADPNTQNGIFVTDQADDTTIGGIASPPVSTPPGTGLGNIVSGNTPGVGIAVGGVASGTRIIGNLIGLDKGGIDPIPNGTGVFVPTTSPTTVVGGTAAGEANVISGNTNGQGVTASAGTIAGNLIGTNATGTAAVPNLTGVGTAPGALVTVGGTTAAHRNVISGNSSVGVLVGGTTSLQGNHIGPALGGGALPTVQPTGIRVITAGGGSTIGGSAPGAGNVISGNTTGLLNIGPLAGLTVQGNTIGLAGDGITPLANAAGIALAGASNVQIGGAATGAGNVISGNTGDAVSTGGSDDTVIEGNTIGLDAGGADKGNGGRGIIVTFNSDRTRIGGTAAGAGNVVSGNGGIGVNLGQDSTATTVQGNLIGLAHDGTTARPNANNGMRVDKSSDALIGGSAPGARNVISGNASAGLVIAGGITVDPVVEGNYIGTDSTGTADRGNGQSGITLGSSTGARIADNVISGNGFEGIGIGGGFDGGAIVGNLIGTAADGTTPLGNDGDGLDISFASDPLTIGGTAAGDGNTIAHNGDDGISVFGTTLGAAFLGNRIHDNGAGDADQIGIDLAGDGVTANDPGDGDNGGAPNQLQNFPVLTSAQTDGATTAVAGTIDTTSGRSVRVEVFSNGACDESGFGQGEVPLGSTTVTTGSGATGFTASVAGTAVGRAVTATATDLTTNETSELSACVTATQPPPAAPAPPAAAPPLVTTPPVAVLPVPVPKFPAKLRVLRNGVDDGTLDMLVEITSRAVTSGAVLSIDYESSGRHTRFTVPVTGTQVKVRKRLPKSQPKDTGITTVSYAGNSVVDPDEARLRAADGKSRLARSSSSLVNGRLSVAGTVTSRARGVVRIRMSYAKADGSTGFEDWNARISGGKWSLAQTLTGDAAKGGQLSIQFTGYEARNLRGEQTAKAVP
jgi:titin